MRSMFSSLRLLALLLQPLEPPGSLPFLVLSLVTQMYCTQRYDDEQNTFVVVTKPADMCFD